MERKTVNLLGFDIDTFDFNNAINYAKLLIEFKVGGQVVTINPEMIEKALENPESASILKVADLVIPDGVGVQLGLKIKGVTVERIAGIEFSHKLIEICAKSNFSVALVGAKPSIIEKAVENLKIEFPSLNIVYARDGYFDNINDVYWELEELKPQLVFVALGFPKQEEFIYNYRKDNPKTVMVGVGGSFDVWAGEVKRAPKIYQKLGLEWLYRTIKEPQRFKRIFPTLPRFLFRVLLGERLKG